jgi:hypothetical protein
MSNSPDGTTTISGAGQSPPTQAAPVTADLCERDGAMLAQLRNNPSLDGVVQFERSLTCEKLRAQVMRLRESLSSVANATPVATASAIPAKPAIVAPPPVVVVAPPPPPPAAPKQEAAPKPPAAPPKVAVATVDLGLRLQAGRGKAVQNPRQSVVGHLAVLERDLGCERLRPQIVRLRESLSKTDISKTDLSKTDPPKPEQPEVANAHAVQPVERRPM